MLVFDKTKGPPKGRVLRQGIPAMHLREHDRLEPSSAVSDVGAFEQLAVPFRATFWRSSLDTLTRRRNPLFSAGTGLDIERMGIDVLHTFSLGIYQIFLLELFWDLIVFNVFAAPGPMSARAELSINRLKEMLFSWYGREERAGRAQPRVNQFLPGILGTFSERAFRVHAAATNGLLYFADYLLGQAIVGARLGPKLRHYKRGLDALLHMECSMKAHPRRYPPAAAQAFVDAVLDHVAACRCLGIGLKPKHHLTAELAAKLTMGQTGFSPLCSATHFFEVGCKCHNSLL